MGRNLRNVGGLALAACLLAGSASAQLATDEEAARAQDEMYARILPVVNGYAASIGLDQGYVSYCETSLNMLTNTQPKDGLMPFGVTYLAIPRVKLKNTIAVREAFEKSYLTLCLAKAKATLRAASAKQ
jgi:hypothetical protein